MPNRRMHILQVNTADVGGGAEKIAWNLLRAYRSQGHDAWLAVGQKRSVDPDVIQVPNRDMRRPWTRYCWDLHARLEASGRITSGASWFSRSIRALAEPKKLLDAGLGREQFYFPGTRRLLQLRDQAPDVVHGHNLHGGYFDLRLLSWLSQLVPTALTLHDAWLMSGHCAHSFDCERWKAGCGHCPDLAIYPALHRDGTSYNWRRKRNIYARSRLYVATPSKWLMEKVEKSILAAATLKTRVIPNGVDLSTFQPADRGAVRDSLGIPQRAKVLLFAANGIRDNIWKDYLTLKNAMVLVADHLQDQEVVFIALGEEAPVERLGHAEIRFIPYQANPEDVAAYYQAADAYIHAAKVDTFPNTVLEALACGTPVVATAVGGVPEQLKGLRIPNGDPQDEGFNLYDVDQATGILARPRDPVGLAGSIEYLLGDSPVRYRMGENAARDAEDRFGLISQAKQYLTWYEEMIAERDIPRGL